MIRLLFQMRFLRKMKKDQNNQNLVPQNSRIKFKSSLRVLLGENCLKHFHHNKSGYYQFCLQILENCSETTEL